MALRHRPPEFLAGAANGPVLAQFISERLGFDRAERLGLGAERGPHASGFEPIKSASVEIERV